MRLLRPCVAVAGIVMLLTSARMADALTLHVNVGWDFVDPMIDGTCGYPRAGLEPLCSLRAAIQEVNAAGAGPHEIRLDDGVHFLWIRGADEDDSASGDLDIRADVRIVGAGPPRWACPNPEYGCWPSRTGAGTYVQSQVGDRVFHILTGSHVEIEGLAVTGGHAPDRRSGEPREAAFGGGIRNEFVLTLTHVGIVNNEAQNGGGLYATDGVTNLEHVSVIGNRALLPGPEGCGGGITNMGLMRLDRSHVGDNDTLASGGGICNRSIYGDRTPPYHFGELVRWQSLEIFDTLIGGNSAGLSGGGLLTSASAIASSVLFSRNRAAANGGAIAIGPRTGLSGALGGNMGLFSSILRRNEARGLPARGGRTTDGLGGAIYTQGTLVTEGTSFTSNGALYGGAIAEVENGTVVLDRTLVAGNSARHQGGGMFTYYPHRGRNHVGDVRLSLYSSTVSLNGASEGGGIYMVGDLSESAIQAALRSATVAHNEAAIGANLAIFNTTLFLNNTIVAYGRTGPNCAFRDDTVTRGSGRNLEDRFDCGFMAPDLAGLDPLLGALQFRGGPTMTHSLEPGSPAIDAVPLDGCDMNPRYPDLPAMMQDQRGVRRIPPPGGFCDIGAFEVEVLPAWATERLFVDFWLLATSEVTATSLRLTTLMGVVQGCEKPATDIWTDTKSLAEAADAFIDAADRQTAANLLKPVDDALGALEATLASDASSCGGVRASEPFLTLSDDLERLRSLEKEVGQALGTLTPTDNPKQP